MITFGRACSTLSNGVSVTMVSVEFMWSKLTREKSCQKSVFLRTRVLGKKSEPQEHRKAFIKSNEKLYSGVTCHALQDGITRFQDQNFSATDWSLFGWSIHIRSLNIFVNKFPLLFQNFSPQSNFCI